jgi:hypothetical protein
MEAVILIIFTTSIEAQALAIELACAGSLLFVAGAVLVALLLKLWGPRGDGDGHARHRGLD